MQVATNPDKITVSHYGQTKTVRFIGTRLGGDGSVRRSVRRVAIQWAMLTGSSAALAVAAWRKLAPGKLPAPSKLSEEEWRDLLTGLDAYIAELVNDSRSRFYLYG